MDRTDEQRISAESAERYVKWLRQEAERLPDGHPLKTEYREQVIEVAGVHGDPVEWDARAEVHIATFIKTYIAQNPAPSGSRVAADFTLWADNLAADGERRLAAAGARRFAVVA